MTLTVCTLLPPVAGVEQPDGEVLVFDACPSTTIPELIPLVHSAARYTKSAKAIVTAIASAPVFAILLLFTESLLESKRRYFLRLSGIFQIGTVGGTPTPE